MQRRILFIHTQGGIGNLLLSSPIAEAIARSWPDAAVTAWVRREFRGLLDGNPWFDCLEAFDAGVVARAALELTDLHASGVRSPTSEVSRLQTPDTRPQARDV